jgi:hypothetical protein
MSGTEIDVRSESGESLPAGEIGGIYLRTPTGPLATYVGSDVKPMDTASDGFTSVGDLGWLDEDGFLFMADRRVDMIVTGAVNVFPAEVEAALSEHPGIADVVVVGLRDPEWGRRVHAIVQASDPTLDADGVIAFARERLAPYKVPKSVEFVESIPRSEAMKFNRAALVEERDGRSPSRPLPWPKGPPTGAGEGGHRPPPRQGGHWPRYSVVGPTGDLRPTWALLVRRRAETETAMCRDSDVQRQRCVTTTRSRESWPMPHSKGSTSLTRSWTTAPSCASCSTALRPATPRTVACSWSWTRHSSGPRRTTR